MARSAPFLATAYLERKLDGITSFESAIFQECPLHQPKKCDVLCRREESLPLYGHIAGKQFEVELHVDRLTCIGVADTFQH